MKRLTVLALVLLLWVQPLPAAVTTFDDHNMATMDAQGDSITGVIAYHTIFIVHNGSASCTVTLQVESKTFFSYAGLLPGDMTEVPLRVPTALEDLTLSASCSGVVVTAMWSV